MKKIPLCAMAHARSGDKGDGSNVGVVAYDDRGTAGDTATLPSGAVPLFTSALFLPCAARMVLSTTTPATTLWGGFSK